MHFNIADLFEKVVDTVPDREALVCGTNRTTYARLERRSNQLAHYLRSQGVGVGDHIGLYLYNCNEYMEAMLACFKIRAVPINVNFRYKQDELRYIFENADIVACIHQREFIPRIASVCSAVSELNLFISLQDHSDERLASIDAVDYQRAISSQKNVRAFAERSDDDLFILYTGGTTGMPKGVMWPHKSVFFAAMGAGGYFSSRGPCSKPEDIATRICESQITGIALAPLMHGASWWYACIQLLAGNKLILNPARSLVGEDVWDICEQEKCNAVQIVGDAMAIPLIDALNANPGRWDLSSIFSVGSGGAVFSVSKQTAFKQHFPDVFISNSFGSSESGQMGMDNGQKKDEEGLGNVSRSEFMDVINVNNTQPQRAKHGEMGIFSRSGYIPIGYYNAPEKTAETFITLNGKNWLLTGDAARLESDDSITVFGRGSNCINTGGEKVFPEEVEQALKAHPDIFDALVVATPDARWGSKVTAVIAARDGVTLTLEQVQQDIRQYIAGYKIPREIHLIHEIPRSPSGKPNYKAATEFAMRNQ